MGCKGWVGVGREGGLGSVFCRIAEGWRSGKEGGSGVCVSGG